MSKIERISVFCAIMCLASFFAAYKAGYRINITPSVPIGVWRIGGEPRKGGYVAVAASEHAGYRLAVERQYLSDTRPMLKLFAAAEGDVVSYDTQGKAVTVNENYISMTEIFERDTEGRPLPSAAFPLRLEAGQGWVSSENIHGYDSRYFGPVSRDLLESAVAGGLFF
ncbi:MAG: S26 family signal peptidase [Synergistaceae bacterium]|jgi:conjugative transfer signal peptidase TraF|nr:S26 family signal peptidase [Synergistaceae bacterium]